MAAQTLPGKRMKRVVLEAGPLASMIVDGASMIHCAWTADAVYDIIGASQVI
jgi:hypothetical protein